VVAADDDGRLDLARADEVVDREPGARAIAQAKPADPGGQPLELHSLRCELEPALKECVVREQLLQRRVDRGDVALVP
jgi:hypothetical protein